MLSESQFRELVSGRTRGLPASVTRGLLRAAEVPYTLAVTWRNRRYDRGRATSHAVAVPVISVGNLTLGGTGKTPMVEWLARWYRQRGVRTAIVSRGYKQGEAGVNDEALELEQKLPDVPHLQNPDRVAAARTAIEELDMQLLVLDDAFQHRRIRRDLDLVMIDATQPYGYGHVFPRGTLREPLAGLRRAQTLVLSRADMLAADQRQAIHRRLQPYAPQAAWLEVAHAPLELIGCRGQTAELQSLAGQRVAAFCGIGNPAGFRHTLEGCGCELVELREFPDHHAYERRDLEELIRWAGQQQVAAIVCTHKDLVKIGLDRLGPRPLWAVRVGLRFLAGQPLLEQQLERLLVRIPPDRPPDQPSARPDVVQ
ncbi:MAG: tetraacyldisaccharide 4'-kinase [Pirellulaceae bacterium]|nr:tetraacyldisaccharide 4'-kinase [Pirellulaceae bacterium]